MRQLKSKPAVVICIFLAASFLYYFFTPSSNSNAKDEDRSHLLQQNAPARPSTHASQSAEPPRNSGVVGRGATDDSTPDSTPDPIQETSVGQDRKKIELQNWIAAEAPTLNQPNVDTKQKDLQLKKRVENLSDEEKKMIVEITHDTTRAANDRILAAYMLVLDQSQAGVGNLASLSEKALPDFGPLNAHSEAEIRRGQELAVRYMGVDELSKRAATDPEAREALKKLAASAGSSEARGYAQRVLKEIK